MEPPPEWGACYLVSAHPMPTRLRRTRTGAPLSTQTGTAGGVGDYRSSHGNTPEVVATAHRLRDREFTATFDQIEAVEEYDYVIVGCGIAGIVSRT